MRRRGVSVGARAGVVLAAISIAQAPANATTLAEALLNAYKDNPTLTGQRAQLRATDEQSAIARAAGRPTIGGTVGYTQGLQGLRQLQGFNRSLTAGPQLTVPLFQGGRVRNAIHAADSRVDSGRATLRSTEGNVFVQAVGAYMDVIRDRAIVELNMANVKVLQTNLDATNDQFQAGSLTRTDVAQSRARLEDGRSQLASAQSTLTGSEENYRAVVGLAADTLDRPPPLPRLPATADSAEDTAIAENPDIAAGKASISAAHYDVSTARASRIPSLSGTADTQYYHYLDGFNGAGASPKGQASSAGLTLTVPFYQGGLAGAQVRQAQDLESVAMEQETATERRVVADTRGAFASYGASLEVIKSSEEAVKANTLALEGVRAEQSVGERQVLDVLNAEQELLNSQVTLVSAQRDDYVAGFALLNAMGLVTYQHLGLEGGTLYDPIVDYRHARHDLSDFSENPKPQPVAKPTYGPPPTPENSPVTPQVN